MRQLSGAPNRSYSRRFDFTADALERALRLLGAETYNDGTGMAFVVVKNGRQIGGPSSCQEDAMRAAVRHIEREGAGSIPAASTKDTVICGKCGFLLDVSNPLNCTLPGCRDEACPLDHVGGYPQGLADQRR
jgi:hypothetical protein